jgi:hypothetical protein
VRELRLERGVARHHDNATTREVILDCGLEQLERRRIERDLRLVEQPDRALRGSASLRFCPAESRPAEKSASGVSPKAPSAAGTLPSFSPRKSAQKAKFSRTVKLVLIPLRWPT